MPHKKRGTNETIAAIRKLGGMVSEHEGIKVSLFGNFWTSERFYLSGSAQELLRRLSPFDELIIGYCQLEDQTLEFLEGLAIRSLTIWNSVVSPNSMDFVGRISELNALKLDQIGMQNDWIDPISHLQLIGLDLSSNNLTSGFLRVLHHPKLLRKLRVYNNPMTSDGFEYITQYSGLERLDLTRTQIRSSDCAHIKTLSCLQELDLWHCKGIDDTSVPLLVQMPWLKKVVVASSGLSPSAGRELQRSLPHTKIVTKIGRRSS